LALLVGACGQTPAPAAPRPEVVADAAPVLSEADRRFAIDAAGFARYQVEAARLAEQRASGPMVKAFAALLEQQHGAALAELETLLRSRSTPWVGGIPAERRSVLDALGSLAAVVFDRRFVDQVGIADHQAAILLFESATRNLQDAALRNWAERTLPLLQNHLASAQQIPIRMQAQHLLRPPLAAGMTM
jgi:putative membrane protein